MLYYSVLQTYNNVIDKLIKFRGFELILFPGLCCVINETVSALENFKATAK